MFLCTEIEFVNGLIMDTAGFFNAGSWLIREGGKGFGVMRGYFQIVRNWKLRKTMKYYQKTEGYTTYVGDYYSAWGFPCHECQTYGCSSTANRCCQSFETFIPTSESACWEGLGTISQANLNSHISKLTCSVTGTVTQLCEGSQIISSHCVSHNQPYDIQGVVKTTSTGYYCEIDMSELNDLLPSQIMIPSRDTLQPRGIIAVSNPKVIIDFAQPKTFYTFSNNKCSLITIMENTQTSNDYTTLALCEENIIEIIDDEFEDEILEPIKISENMFLKDGQPTILLWGLIGFGALLFILFMVMIVVLTRKKK